MAHGGVAPIKTEFLLVNSSLSNVELAVAVKTDVNEPVTKKKRGQFKHRPREQRASGKEKLCPSVLNESECKFGDNCKYSHDVSQYWANREADIGTVCVLYRTLGKCPYSFQCRFAADHTIVDSTGNLTNMVKETLELCPPTVNLLPKSLQIELRKNKHDFSTVESIVERVCNDSTKVGNLVTCLSEDNKEVNCDGVENGRCISSENMLGTSELSTVSQCCNHDYVEVVHIGSVTDEDFIKVRLQERRRLDVAGKLYLAPLTTVGNLPFRRVCVQLGAQVTCGEMALASELLKGNQSEWALVKRDASERLFGVQLAGGHPSILGKCAQLLVEHCELDFIDLNLGCPIDLICNKMAGCALIERTRKLSQICQVMAESMNDIPLTLKFRTGIKEGSNKAHKTMAAVKCLDLVSLFTLHGRSREQRYSKLAQWDYIVECANVCQPVPLFGVGDVLSFEDYYSHVNESSPVAGAMIARGALIKPWIFTEITERRHWDITAAERLEILKKFVNFGLQHWGSDTAGVGITRRFLLEWLSFLYRYIPVGLLERLPQKINERPPFYRGRNDLETQMASPNCADWIKISEILLGKTPPNFLFLPKHKANAY